MSNSIINPEVLKAMVTLLEAGVGYSISLHPELTLRSLDDSTFAVDHERHDQESGKHLHVYEKLFAKSQEAAVFFEQERRRLQLGDDIENENIRALGETWSE